MNNIKIVRLKNGDDLVGSVNTEYGICISEPMLVHINFRNNEPQGVLQLAHWLPIQLIKKNEAMLHPDSVLTMLEPEDEFKEYYINAVQKIKSLMEAKNDLDQLNDQEIMEIMESMKLNNNQVVH